MDIAAEIRNTLGDEWAPAVYREKVRRQRTRAYSFEIPQRENEAEIQYTLLGIDLKVGKWRFACPDLATARYIRIFARLGCCEFAVPYDITKISAIADELETSWQKMLLLIDKAAAGKDSRSKGRFRGAVIKTVRTEINAVGAGEAMPQFNRPTNQRLT